MNTKTMLTTTTVLSSIIAVEGIVFLAVSNENLIGPIVLVVGIILIGASIMMNSNPDTKIFSIEQETYAKLLLGLSFASVVISTILLIISASIAYCSKVWKKITSKWVVVCAKGIGGGARIKQNNQINKTIGARLKQKKINYETSINAF